MKAIKKTKVPKLISLKFLMVLIIVLLIIIPLVSVSFIDYRRTVTETQDKYGHEISIQTSNIQHSTETLLNNANLIVNELSKDPDILLGDETKQKAVLQKIAKMNPMFELLYTTNAAGMQTARSSGDNGDRSDREWFKMAFSGKNYLSGSYISKATNQPTVTIALPLQKDGKIIGTIGADLSLSYLQTLIKDVKVGSEGYGYMTDQSGIAIAHPNFSEYVTKQVNISKTFAVAEGLKGQTGVSNWVNSKGVSFYGAYLPISTPDAKSKWVVVVQIPQSEITAKANSDLSRSGLLALLFSIAAAVVVYFVSNIFIKPVRKVIETTSAVGQGDLTATILNKTKTREYQQLNDAVNNMISQLRDLLLTTQKNAQQVANSAVHLSATTTSISDSSQQIAATMEQLSAGNENQTLQVDSAAVEVEQMRNEINGIANKSNNVRELTEALSNEATRSMAGVNQATQQMDKISDAARSSAEQIHSLQTKSKQIEQMVILITDIAQQTNLLALNAAIEAARAGEAGRGFAVVADEVRKLAEQSGQAAEQITSVIAEIQTETTRAVEAMTNGTDEAEKGTQIVKQTLDSLGRITAAIQDIVDNTREVADATARMNQSTEDVSGVVANLAAISEESAAATEEVTASVNEQSSTIQELAESTKGLSELANELERTVKQFKIDDSKQSN